MFYVLSFLFGASIGSFVQVVATRLHIAPIIKARSKCLSCGEALRAYDLIPIISYVLLGGKCRYCSSRYGVSALLVEVLYGVVYMVLFHFVLVGQSTLTVSFLWLIYYSLLFITFGVMALYDRAHTYIPVEYLFFYSILTFGMLVVRFIHESTSMSLLAPVIVALPFLLAWIITRGKGLGFGDVLLFLGVGAFFGVEQGLAVLFLSVWMGAIVGVVSHVARRKGSTKNKAIPFVPFIVISFIVVLFTDIDIFSIAQIFN